MDEPKYGQESASRSIFKIILTHNILAHKLFILFIGLELYTEASIKFGLATTGKSNNLQKECGAIWFSFLRSWFASI